MADFGLIKSFDIDDGQLDEMTVQQAFVLGYELASIDALLNANAGFQQLIHASNRERIEKSCVDATREFKITWMEGDPSEDWMMLCVAERQS